MYCNEYIYSGAVSSVVSTFCQSSGTLTKSSLQTLYLSSKDPLPNDQKSVLQIEYLHIKAVVIQVIFF